MKKWFKRILALMMVVIMAIGVVSAPVIRSGYSLYKEAVQQKPIEEKVNEIMTSDGYTALDEISPVFIEKLLESEDRRFYKHFAIDPIADRKSVV